MQHPPTGPHPKPPEKVKFFARRKKIYPRRVQGRFRRLKWLVMLVTLAIYYLAPFLRWDRGPNAPDQAILIDLPSRRAYFFFIEIWPQETYYLTGILILAAIGLFFVTSLFGRVWCGYLCPQTVWTDLFVKVESLIQGDRAARQKLDQAGLSFEKIWKKTATHALWILIGLATGGSFVFYFNDAPTLWSNLLDGHISPTVAIFVLSLTFSTWLMAGFSREQVCVYMCPYARFQSAMFDRDTMIITYDPKRGEPRGHLKKSEGWANRGHCVDCTACVQVCPMGIDIRDGLQIDCIACGLCVDACDNVMSKLDLPRGLIRYDTERHMAAPQEKRLRMIRPRTVYYIAILAIVSSVMLYGLATRKEIDLHVLHDRNPMFVALSDGRIRNGYDVKILNKTHEDKVYSLTVDGIAGGVMSVGGVGHLTADALPVPADSVGNFHIFVSAPRQADPRTKVQFHIIDQTKTMTDAYESMFVGEKRPR